MMPRGRVAACVIAAAVLLITAAPQSLADESNCRRSCPGGPEVGVGDGALTAAYVSDLVAGVRVATNVSEAPQLYLWQLRTNCAVSDADLGGCRSAPQECPQIAGRLVELLIVQRRPGVQANGLGPTGQVPPPGAAPGTAFDAWRSEGPACVDVTDLN